MGNGEHEHIVYRKEAMGDHVMVLSCLCITFIILFVCMTSGGISFFLLFVFRFLFATAAGRCRLLSRQVGVLIFVYALMRSFELIISTR